MKPVLNFKIVSKANIYPEIYKMVSLTENNFRLKHKINGISIKN